MASIPCAPAVGHAIGTVIPRAIGGALIGIALIGLVAHVRKHSEIQWRTSPLRPLLVGDPNAKPLSSEELQQALLEQIEELNRGLQCMDSESDTESA